MKCRRVEKLIPLYVGGDLAPGAADRVTSHLEWCGRCNWLADEFKESHNWLQSSEEPVFDEAALNTFKAGVLRRIPETSAKPSLMSSLMQHWSRRQIFALAAATLVVFGMVVLYVYQSRARNSVPVPKRAESNPSEELVRPDEQRPEPGKDKAHVAGLNRRRHPLHRRIYAKAKNRRPSLEKSIPVQTGVQARAARARVPIVNSTAHFGGSPAMLRIEIQTSDPNIRIIWFAPKETDSHQTKPVTD
jgi:hypothetical protein